MKAKVIEETPYSPNFKKGDVVEIVPGMETDSEGIWNIPGGRLFLCRTEDGHQAYMFPSCLQVLTGEESDSVSEFRKEAATRFAASILSNPMWYKRFSGHSVAAQFDNAYFKKHVMCNAISYADALIKELRLKPYKDIRQTHRDTIRVFRPIAGTTIQKAAKEAVEMVKEEGRPIMLSFNSASILVEPYETEDTVLEHYHRWCHSRIASRESEKKDYGHWKKIAEKKPDDGMDVFLFLGDRRIIRVIWSQGADDAAQAIGIAEQDCYPLYWCEAQMKVRDGLQDNHMQMIQWTGDNLKEVIDFTGKSPRFGEWFNSWEEYENYVHTHNDILKLFCEDGSHYEVPVGAWIVKTPDGYNLPSVAKYIQQEQPEVDIWKEIHNYFNPHGMELQFDRSKGNTILKPEQLFNFASHFAEWGAIHLNARKEGQK